MLLTQYTENSASHLGILTHNASPHFDHEKTVGKPRVKVTSDRSAFCNIVKVMKSRSHVGAPQIRGA